MPDQRRGGFTTFAVDDPHRTTEALWDRFPPGPSSAITAREFHARSYAALDWRRFRLEPAGYRSEFAVGQVGALCLARIADRCASALTIKPPGLDLYCLSFMQQGNGQLRVPGRRDAAAADQTDGVIFRGLPNTQLETDNDSAKLNIWIPAGLVHRSAAALLDGGAAETIEFETGIDCTTGPGAALRRLAEFLFSELARPDSLLTSGIGAAPAEEWLVQSVLLGLVHTQSGQLRRQRAVAAPRNVRRAEEFIRANAAETVTVAEIAQAAGCSIRALQLAFRRFRNATPMAVMRRIRLEQAHQDIVRSDGSQSVTGIALKYGFANLGRFAALYRQMFGEPPSATLGQRRLSRRLGQARP